MHVYLSVCIYVCFIVCARVFECLILESVYVCLYLYTCVVCMCSFLCARTACFNPVTCVSVCMCDCIFLHLNLRDFDVNLQLCYVTGRHCSAVFL